MNINTAKKVGSASSVKNRTIVFYT